MRIFSKPFPETGFYVVTEEFRTENMEFIPGEPVAIARWGSSPYVRITKTGERFGGYTNYMEVEHMPKLRKLTNDEVAGLIADGFRVEFEELNDIEYLAAVCRHVVLTMPVAPAQ